VQEDKRNMRQTEGGSSSLESLGSLWDCIINNPRSTVARRNAQESEGQGRKINDLNVFSTFCHGGAFRCTFLRLPSRNCSCVGSTNYKPIYRVLVPPFSSHFCVFRVDRTVSLSTPVMSQFFSLQIVELGFGDVKLVLAYVGCIMWVISFCWVFL